MRRGVRETTAGVSALERDYLAGGSIGAGRMAVLRGVLCGPTYSCESGPLEVVGRPSNFDCCLLEEQASISHPYPLAEMDTVYECLPVLHRDTEATTGLHNGAGKLPEVSWRNSPTNLGLERTTVYESLLDLSRFADAATGFQQC